MRRAKAVDVDFYRSQLSDIDGDVGRGLLSDSEAAATRTEIGRRLLSATAQPEVAAPTRGFRARRMAAILAAVVLVPGVALGLYGRLGHPGEPDLPLSARADAPNLDMAGIIAKIEAHLAADPNDGRGFQLIAPIYVRLGRFDDAARAYAATIRTLGDNADRRAALGQALVMAADGVVTADARGEFDKALAQDPKLPQARYFQAVAAEQDGDMPRAKTLWTALAADAPADAPWLATVRQHLDELDHPKPAVAQAGAAPDGTAPPLQGKQAEAAGIAALAPEQRIVAIRGMVDGLATRLAQNGRDQEGWLRLIKAYTVLGDGAKARAALVDARKGLGGDASALARIDALARQLGLEG